MKKIIPIFMLLAACMARPAAADGAMVSVSAPDGVTVGQMFQVTVYADTAGVSINSADVTLDYPDDLLAFSGYQEANSLVKVWLAPPSAGQGAVHFAGIIPGGAAGLYDPRNPGLSAVPLAVLDFTARAEGTAEFSLEQSDILQNDGHGTPLAHDTAGADVSIVEAPVGVDPNQGAVPDTAPPEKFSITFLDSSFFSRTPAMIVFSATDLGSGVMDYRIKKIGSAWVPITSPHPVTKTIFAHTVTVRAYDFAGNYRDESVVIPASHPARLIAMGILILLGGIFAFRMIKWRA